MRPRPRLTVDAVDEIQSRLAAGLSDTGGSDFGPRCKLYAVPGIDYSRSSIQEAAPCGSFISCLCFLLLPLHFVFSEQTSSPSQSVSSPSTESLAASSTPSRYLALPRLSTSFITWFPSFFFSDSPPTEILAVALSHEVLFARLGLTRLALFRFLVFRD